MRRMVVAGMLLVASSQVLAQQGRFVWEDYSKRIGASRQVSPLGLLTALLCLVGLLACTNSGGRVQSEGGAESSARSACVSYGEKYFIFDQLELAKADQAINGDVSASWEIVTQLLSLGGDGARDPLHACQIQFWADVSAQNGSLSAAYELALMPEMENAYRCRRSKYWANIVLSRLDEFNQETLRDADPELVQRSLNGRREQMKQSLAKICPDF